MLGNRVEVAVVVKQGDIVLDCDICNHTVNRLTDRETPLTKGSVKLGCMHECRLPHGQEDKIV
jgi:hypothetical protein